MYIFSQRSKSIPSFGSIMKSFINLFLCVVATIFAPSTAFTPSTGALSRGGGVSAAVAPNGGTVSILRPAQIKSPTLLSLSGNDEFESSLSESDQTILGAAGTLAALIVFYSEFTLKTTGCGLPAGPFGIFGFAEGLSYLGVTGLVAYSVVTKVKTGSGLPAGPGGLLGAAEGLSYLAILAGLVVLALQITNYGYIPNAVPMEGAMCS